VDLCVHWNDSLAVILSASGRKVLIMSLQRLFQTALNVNPRSFTQPLRRAMVDIALLRHVRTSREAEVGVIADTVTERRSEVTSVRSSLLERNSGESFP
jgi:hypothetical protein